MHKNFILSLVEARGIYVEDLEVRNNTFINSESGRLFNHYIYPQMELLDVKIVDNIAQTSFIFFDFEV